MPRGQSARAAPVTRVIAKRVQGYFNLYEVPRELLPEFDLPERDDIFVGFRTCAL